MNRAKSRAQIAFWISLGVNNSDFLWYVCHVGKGAGSQFGKLFPVVGTYTRLFVVALFRRTGGIVFCSSRPPPNSSSREDSHS